jgi:serine/threonine-protein kinase RsbW
MVQVSREYRSDPRQLPAMRALVGEAGRSAWGPDADEDALGQLALAVHEAATNIIRHAYGGETAHPIHVLIEGGPDHVCVTLAHHGPDFDPGVVEAPAFDGSREGGFGLFMIGQLVDEVVYGRDHAGRRVVRLVKRRIRAPQGRGTCS